MFSDYCRGNVGSHSQAFLDYVKSRDYDLHTVTQYGNILEKAGFTNVSCHISVYTYSDLTTRNMQIFEHTAN